MIASEQAPEQLGNCFQTAFERLVEMGENSGGVLVNGYVTGQAGSDHQGEKFAHGWIELAGGHLVHDTEMDVTLMADRYYELGGIIREDCYSYTLEQAYDFIESQGDECFLPFEIEPSDYELGLGVSPNPNSP